MKRKKQSKILNAVHATAKGLHDVGAIDLVTMREFDPMRIAPIAAMRPTQIKRIRESSHVSQAVFAALLNTSVSTVQKWEIGQKKPTGTALKLLHLVRERGLDAVA